MHPAVTGERHRNEMNSIGRLELGSLPHGWSRG